MGGGGAVVSAGGSSLAGGMVGREEAQPMVIEPAGNAKHFVLLCVFSVFLVCFRVFVGVF